MGRKKIPSEMRKAIREARRLIQDVEKMDGNEATTRMTLERIFEGLMGYDVLRHLSRERAVKGAAETEHVDFAIQLEQGPDAKPLVMVEVKKVGMDLALKHLKQVSTYAINAGCEWILLTNGRDWRIYHVEFGQPPETTLLEQWNLLHDDAVVLADKFALLSYKNIKRGGLNALWRKTKLLEPRNLLAAILCEASLPMAEAGYPSQ